MQLTAWAWSRRTRQEFLVGPFTCPACRRVGAFCLVAVERRLSLYGVAVGPWRDGGAHAVCPRCLDCTHLATDPGALVRAA